MSDITTSFPGWRRTPEQGKSAWLLSRDNASWQQITQENRGVRILPCSLPTKRPWLNWIEPAWVHT